MLRQKEAAARLMEHLCTHNGNDGHGYSQPHRMGDGTTEEVDLGDGVVVTIPGGDRDCSSAIVTVLKAVGVETYGASYTGNMRSQLLRNPLFTWHAWGDGYVAQRGDIYLNEGCHTAMCTSADPDMLAQFSISEKGTVDGETGDQTGSESNIRAFYVYSKGWDGKIAWASDGELIGSDPLPAALQGFTDVEAGAWYVDVLEKAVVNGWLHGYGNGCLGPGDSLTRAQAVVVIANAAGASYTHPYEDVTAGTYYYDAVSWAKENHVVSSENSSFRPEDACTRAEFCQMLCNWRQGRNVGTPTGMSDWPDVPQWAQAAVAWGVENGVIGSTGQIRPNDACTRAEACAMLSRAYDA